MLYTTDDVLSAIRTRVKKAGTQVRVAADLGVSPVYLSDVLAGRRAPGPTLLRALGYARAARFERRP